MAGHQLNPHRRLQRTLTSIAKNKIAAADERTPLLDRDSSASWRRVAFDPTYAPGKDSPNFITRTAAHAWQTLKIILLCNYLNVLLIFLPLGILAAGLNWGPVAVFVLNFLALIPLAGILSYVTEELALHLGEIPGGLLNATFGNAVQLIVSIIALTRGEIEVVQSSLLGAIISNILLVMGFCFLLGGLCNMRDALGRACEQNFASATSQQPKTLMTLASVSMVLPSVLYLVLEEGDEEDTLQKVLQLSRGTSIVLLCLYICYMIFQLHTHDNLFLSPDSDAAWDADSETTLEVWGAVVVLVISTALTAICAEDLVESLDDFAEDSKLSKNFVGLILIPIVSNAAEHATACVAAIKNKMDLALAVILGASVQIALLVTPVLVLLGWALGQPMSLHFHTFETVSFVFSVLVVSYVLQDGRSNYLEGAMLLGLYAIIAIGIWAVPKAFVL